MLNPNDLVYDEKVNRLLQVENDALIGQKQSEMRLHFPFTSEKLYGFTQERLQRIGDRATEIICMHLGIDLDDLVVFQDGLTHLNDQATGRKDKSESFGKVFRNIIQPQMKTLRALVQERLHTSEWKVDMNSVVLVGDMMNISIKSTTKDLTINLYERGFHIDSPDLEIAWNMFPGARDGSDIARSKDTNITAYQKEDALGLPLPAIKIQADPTVSGDGVLQYMQTDSGRDGIKPRITELVSPKKLLSQATYNKDGSIRYLKLVFPVPNTPRSLSNNIVMLYDFRQNEPTTGMLPTQSKFIREGTSLELPVYPEITIENGILRLTFNDESDAFPLQTATPIEIAEHLNRMLKRHFPAKKPFPTLSQG